MFISCDAKQLEWRTIVELSQDQVALQEILNGQDTHELNRVAFNLPSRLIAKIYLFRTIFRGSGWSFANDPDFSHVSASTEFWEEINTKFFAKYHGIDAQHHLWKNLVQQGLPILSPLGREWELPLLNKYNKINWTQITNYPVQGTGADIMMIARVSFFKRLKQSGLPVKLIQTVHDSIVCDGEEKYVQDIVNLYHAVFKDIQMNIKKIFNYEWITPLECECYVGKNQKEHIDVKPTL